MKSRKRALACSGSMSLPRLSHQRTRISCQRSIAARSSAGVGHVAQLEPAVVEPAHVAPQVLAALARQRLRGTPRTSRGARCPDRASGRRARTRSPAARSAASSAEPVGQPAEQQRVPFVRRARGSRAATAAVTSARAAGQREHAPVVARRAARAPSAPGTARAGRRRAARARPAGRRRARSRSRAASSRTSAATTRAPSPRTRTESPPGRARNSSSHSGSSGSSGAAMKLGAHARSAVAHHRVRPRRRSMRSARPVTASRAQQQAGERVARRPRGAGVRSRRAVEQAPRRAARRRREVRLQPAVGDADPVPLRRPDGPADGDGVPEGGEVRAARDGERQAAVEARVDVQQHVAARASATKSTCARPQ